MSLPTNEELQRLLNRMYEETFGRAPRWRYIEDTRGWMYGWTTERMGDGKYAAFIHKPIGKGSRSGRRKVERWKKVREVHFTKRSTAKARAERWYETAQRQRSA